MERTYAQVIIAARERSRALGVLDNATELLAARLSLPHEPEYLRVAGEVAAEALGDLGWSPRELATKCMHAHTGLWVQLVRMGVPAVLTIGDIIVDGEPVFQVTEERLRADLATPHPTADLHVHAWITTPRGGIIDSTIRSLLTPREARPQHVFRLTAVRAIPPDAAGTATVVGFDDVEHTVRWEPWLLGRRFIDEVSPADAPAAPHVEQAFLAWMREAREGNDWWSQFLADTQG